MFHNELNKQYYLFNHSPKQSLSFDQIVIPLPEWLSKNTCHLEYHRLWYLNTPNLLPSFPLSNKIPMKWGCYHSYQLLFATLSLTPNSPPLWWPFLLKSFFGYSQIYWYTWLLTNTVSYLWHLIVDHQLFKDVNFSCQPQINSNHLRNLTLYTHMLTH